MLLPNLPTSMSYVLTLNLGMVKYNKRLKG